MNTDEKFDAALRRIDELIEEVRAGASTPATIHELGEIRAEIKFLSCDFAHTHYFRIRVSHDRVPKERREFQMLLDDCVAGLILTAKRTSSANWTPMQQSAHAILAHKVNTLFASMRPGLPLIRGNHVTIET